MAKKSLIEKQKRLIAAWEAHLAAVRKAEELPKEKRDEVLGELKAQRVKKRLFKARVYRRCSITGRASGNIRHFGVCRQVLRELAHNGLLPGVTKSSW